MDQLGSCLVGLGILRLAGGVRVGFPVEVMREKTLAWGDVLKFVMGTSEEGKTMKKNMSYLHENKRKHSK